MGDWATYVNPCYVTYFTAKQYKRAVATKNGLDVFYVGGREDGSSTTEEIAFVPFIMGNEPNFTEVLDNVVESYYFYPNTYGLGHGWSLSFSAIETYAGGVNEKEKRRLITRDGAKYEIDFTSDNESHLIGYESSDMIMHKSGNGYTGASYNLEYKDGTREYFNSDGKIIAIVDRFGNDITFSYTYDPTNAEGVTAIYITDTLGRVVSFEKGTEVYDPTALPEMDSDYADEQDEGYYAYNEKWTLKLDGTLIKTYYIRTDLKSDISYQYLIGVEDSLGDITEYHYGDRSYQFNGWVPVASANDEIREACVLENIIYPNGLMKELSTNNNTPVDRLGNAGYSDYFCVKYYSAYHETDNGRVNLVHKAYVYGDYAGVEPESALNDTYETVMSVKHVKRVSLTKSYAWTGRQHTYSFDDEEHYKIKEIVKEYPFIQHEDVTVEDTSFSDLTADIEDYTAKRVQETTYEYNDINLPTEISTSHYNPGSTSVKMTQTYSYTYDEKGNVLTETRPNGLVITNTYSEDYSIPLTTTYKQNDATTVVSTNTLTSDNKSITQNTVTSNGTTAGKTAYTYDSYGRVVTEKKYSNSSTYAETQYTYTTGFAQPTAVISKDIRNADGALVTGTTGYSSGQLATRYQYNDKGEITAETDPNGNTTGIQYDAAGRITRVTNPDGTYASYTYDVANNTVLYTDERGTVLRYEYDPFGSLTGIYDVAGSQYLSQTEYGSYGWPIKEIQHSNGSDKITCYRYDAAGRPIDVRTEDENGTVTSRTTYEYTYANSLFKIKQTVVGDSYAPDVVTTTYKDNMDQTVKTGKFLNGTEYFDTYTYDNVGNVLTEQTAYSASLDDDYTYQYTYDVNGNVLTQKDALGNTTRYSYNWLGNLSQTTAPMGNITYYTYDKLGRKIREEQPYSEQEISDEEMVTIYVDAKLYYDKNGNLISEKHANNDEWADTTWAQTDYAYDNRDRLLKVTAYDNGSVENVTQYYYDAGGNILRMYTGLSSPLTITGLDSVSGSDTSYAVTKYTYDRFGNQLTMTDPLNKTETYTYDLNGNPLTKVDRNNITTTYTYDSLGRLTKALAGYNSRTYSYTMTGQKASERSGNSATYTYDSLGRVISVSTSLPDSGTLNLPEEEEGHAARASGGEFGPYIDAISCTYSYTYDIGDHRTGYMLRANSKNQIDNTYAYDAMGRMASVTDKDSNTTRYTYNANGARSSITYPNGVVGTYTYNQVNLLEKITYSGTDSATKPSYTYTYYLDGNLASETKQNGEYTSYMYDDLGRLTREATRTSASGSLIQSYVYTYDDFGNRASMTASGSKSVSKTYTYDLANHLVREVGGGKTITYTYDGNGNQITKNTGSATTAVTNIYDSFNQLEQTMIGDVTAVYSYNASGIRHAKWDGSNFISYALDGNNVVLEANDGSIVDQYVYGVNLISRDGSSYYLHNGHGDVTYLTDDDGAITKTYEYDAFGNEENPVSTDTNSFRYAGEYYDTETGTYYLRARYYDPIIGRFTQEDPARHSTNWYLYCYCNPVRYTDPNGKFPVETFADAVSTWFSFKELISDPNWGNAGFFAWDLAALFTPYATGSYVAKGISLFGKADDVSDLVRAFTKADNLADAANVFKANNKSIVGSYKDIKRVVKGLGIKDMEVHHLIEKRFASTLNKMNPRYMSSVALDKDTHQTITNLMREYIPYDSIFKGSEELTTSTADPQIIWDALCKTYTHKKVNMPEYIDILKEDFIAAGFNLDWEHWKK